jgi:hypothetical protein
MKVSQIVSNLKLCASNKLLSFNEWISIEECDTQHVQSHQWSNCELKCCNKYYRTSLATSLRPKLKQLFNNFTASDKISQVKLSRFISLQQLLEKGKAKNVINSLNYV